MLLFASELYSQIMQKGHANLYRRKEHQYKNVQIENRHQKELPTSLFGALAVEVGGAFIVKPNLQWPKRLPTIRNYSRGQYPAVCYC